MMAGGKRRRRGDEAGAEDGQTRLGRVRRDAADWCSVSAAVGEGTKKPAGRRCMPTCRHSQRQRLLPTGFS
jgi:hypothetical protein